MPQATIDTVLDGDLQTAVETRGTGTPIVYLPAEEAWAQDPLFDHLAERFRVYAPHLARTEQSLLHLDNIHDLLIHTNDVLDALNVGPVPIIGHSFGAMIAAELAAMNPERATHLILIAPLGLWDDNHPVSELSELEPTELARRLWVDPDSPAAQTWLQSTQTDSFARMQSIRAAYHFTFPIPERGLRKRLHRITCPTLLIWGDQDGITPPFYADTFNTLIPHAQQHHLTAAGHMLTDPQAADTTTTIQTFLTTNTH